MTMPEMRERFRKLKGESHKAVSNKQNKEGTDFMEALTQAMANANPSFRTSEKLLARQVQGRELPQFTGKPEEWPGFYSAYITSSKNCGYSDADNLPRLQRCLKGEALRTVQCMLVSPDGVPSVIEKLKRRFGRPEIIIDSLVKKARECPPVKPDNMNTYIDFGIIVDDLTSTMTALGCSEHLNNPILLSDLVKKLPSHNQIDWAKFIATQPKEAKNMKVFAEWLSATTDAVYSLCPPPTKPAIEEKGGYRRNQRKERVFSSRDDKTESSGGKQNPKEKKCCFCEKIGHHGRECHNFQKLDIDKRWQLVKEKKVCFCCLGLGHRSQECRFKKSCEVSGCSLKHNKLLHNDKPRSSSNASAVKTTQEEVSPDEEEEIVQTTNEVRVTMSGSRVNHMMLPVYLHGKKGRIPGYAILDNLSSIHSMEEETAKRLGLEGEVVPLTVKGFNTTATHSKSRSVNVTLSSKSKDFSRSLTNVRTVDKLDLPRQSVSLSVLEKWKHLHGLPIEPFENEKPTILIGMADPYLHLHFEIRMTKNANAPIAVRTALGWILIGRTDLHRCQHYAYSMREEIDLSLHNLVKDYFTTDSFGVKPQLNRPRSKEDQRGQSIMDTTLRRITGGWEIGLLWKEDNPILPESKSMALNRLRSMEKKMDRDPEFARQYIERIQEYQNKGYARLLSKEEAALEPPHTFYLPHFMAKNPKKPNKLRFVFDAAARTFGKCLNDFLLQGPDKLASLPGVLLKFRKGVVGLTADIEDMFHRVKVRREDVCAQRFLWRGMNRTEEPQVMEMGVLIFGATCSPACAQEAKNRNAMDFNHEYPAACEAIVRNHYVDDLLDSVDTPEIAIKLQAEIQEIHLQGGFNIRNWLTNSKEVLRAIPEEMRAKTQKNMDMTNEMQIERVLGLFWNPSKDVFTFSLTFLKAHKEVLSGRRIPTKREILALVMSIYDPLGLLAILTIKAKMIIQKTWKSNIEWDHEIPPAVIPLWKYWLEELNRIPTFTLSRCYSPHFTSADEIQLHVFGDAGEEAFGAVAYFRIKKGDNIDVSLVMAKAKVAPIKILSIPRLELQASVMGARLAQFITEELKVTVNTIVFWSDSTTVIGWIKSDGSRYQQFVSNRIGEIQELSDPSQWRWLPTEENVADELTRFNRPCDWSENSRWIKGPEWLYQPEETWPVQPEPKYQNPPELEVRKTFVHSTEEIPPLVDIKRFSSYRRLINCTAYVQRYAKRLRGHDIPNSRVITIPEFEAAEKWWWKIAQSDSYKEEIELINSGERMPKKSRVNRFNLMIDDEGLLRVRGRLQNARVPASVKQPIVLNSIHPFTRLLVSHFHQQCGHHGQERIANEMRQEYFIPGLRTAVRSAQSRCQLCKNARAKPEVPEMGQLPSFRLEPNVRPFNKTGLDYFGPVEVVVKRAREKRYVALFTCLSTRAVHLEIAGSLNTDSCIMAIRRFVSRRGCPAQIHSDNGTNFHGANNELKKALEELNQEKLEESCTLRGIEWRFIAPAAPHMGGSWERMVRAVKVALGSTLEIKVLHEEILHTLLIEAEHSVNSHPLTHVPEDPDDPETLTPNHFLIGCSSNLQPVGKFGRDDLFGRKHWRIVQHLANHFWTRWVKEFIPTLLRRDKWSEKTRPIQMGDVVIEVNPNLPRNSWPKGKVIKTYPGKDGHVRVVDIILANGHTFKRPVAKLCVLDVIRNSSPKEDNEI